MSLGKRIFDVARANVGDFVRVFQSEADDPFGPTAGPASREAPDDDGDPSESTVGARAGRAAGRAARKVRDSAEEAWQRAFEAAQARREARLLAEGIEGPLAKRQRWYATLEVTPGASAEEIRRSYRRLLKQYHPDRFANDPSKYDAATELTRKLTEAYNGLKAISEA